MAIDNSTILNASRAYLLMKKQREEKLKKDQNLQLVKEKNRKRKNTKQKKNSKMKPNEAFWRAEKLILEKYKEPPKKKSKTKDK